MAKNNKLNEKSNDDLMAAAAGGASNSRFDMPAPTVRKVNTTPGSYSSLFDELNKRVANSKNGVN